jgi:inosine/xanthosine triphosphatase
MIVAVGTTNEAKLRAVKDALHSIGNVIKDDRFKEIIVKGIKCDSLVSNQPLSEQDTQTGAMNRATQAIELCIEADFGIGIESGLENIHNRWFESGWVVVTDRQGNLGFGSSNRYEIRSSIMHLIQNGLELSEAIERITGLEKVKTTLGMSGVITNGIIKRDDSYRDAILFAFSPFVSDDRLWQ